MNIIFVNIIFIIYLKKKTKKTKYSFLTKTETVYSSRESAFNAIIMTKMINLTDFQLPNMLAIIGIVDCYPNR